MKIGVDCLGGDRAPTAMLEAVERFLGDYRDVQIVLFGDANLETEAEKYRYLNCRDVKKVTTCLKDKREFSAIGQALQGLKNDYLDAFVTSGDTTRLVITAIREGLVLPNARRTFFPLPMPKRGGRVWLVDGGAKIKCSAQDLLSFAELTVCYLESQGIKNPKVGLLNIGTEDHKGDDVVKEAKEILLRSGLNFHGFIEANQLPFTDLDIVVCDGRDANNILKGVGGYLSYVFQLAFFSSLIFFPLFPFVLILGLYFRRRFSYDSYGGTLLLGTSRIMVKAHGRAGFKAFYKALERAYQAYKNDELGKLSETISQFFLAQDSAS